MTDILTWLAPIATTIAALMTASNLGTRVTGWGFVVFTVGSLAWLGLGIVTGQPNLLWQNVILTGLNLFGIWRWLGRQARIEQGGEAAARASQRSPGETLFPVSLLTKGEVTGKGASLGHAVDAMAGCDSGRIAYLVVAEGGVGGVGETLRRVDWTEAQVVQGSVRLALDERRFATLPEVAPDRWPER